MVDDKLKWFLIQAEEPPTEAQGEKQRFEVLSHAGFHIGEFLKLKGLEPPKQESEQKGLTPIKNHWED